MTSSNGNIYRVTGPLLGEPRVCWTSTLLLSQFEERSMPNESWFNYRTTFIAVVHRELDPLPTSHCMTLSLVTCVLGAVGSGICHCRHCYFVKLLISYSNMNDSRFNHEDEIWQYIVKERHISMRKQNGWTLWTKSSYAFSWNHYLPSNL